MPSYPEGYEATRDYQNCAQVPQPTFKDRAQVNADRLTNISQALDKVLYSIRGSIPAPSQTSGSEKIADEPSLQSIGRRIEGEIDRLDSRVQELSRLF